MSVLLVSPPLFKACEPSLGIATLQAYLRAHGVECGCIDANVEAQDWLLDVDRLDEQVRSARAPLAARTLSRWKGLRRQLDGAKRDLRGPEGYRDPGRYRTQVTTLNHALRLAGRLHDGGDSPIEVSLSNHEDPRFCDMSSDAVAAAAATPTASLFHEYFDRVLLPRIRQRAPRVLGISLIFRSQLLPGFVLAGMVRERLPGVHVTLGGELLSAWAPILEHTRLPELADSLLVYEGELGLLALARAVSEGRPLETVPNLCWRGEDGVLHRNPVRKLQSLAEVPAPEFDGLPWDLYFAAEPTAPLVTARGCYWNRCTFCPEVINPESRLRLARSEQVFEEMQCVHRREGVRSFHFIDSALPPSTMRGIARLVQASGRPYRWYGFSRLEASLLEPGFAHELARGGCRMLKLGLETASQRLLDGMDKKQDVDTVARVLRALHSARILVHAFLMFGTPRERREDALQTQRFVAELAPCIQFLNCSLMNLAHGSPMGEDPPRHGITGVRAFELDGQRLDLALYSHFEGEGWSRRAARNFLETKFERDPAVRPSVLRTPAHFDSNHSVFLHEAVFGTRSRPDGVFTGPA